MECPPSLGAFFYERRGMANEKVLAKKKALVEEIKDKFNNSKSVVMFDYRGLTDAETKEIRTKLREEGADYKVYKNTLLKIALDDLKIDLDEFLKGPSAVAFGEEELSVIKVLFDEAKNKGELEIKTGLVNGKVMDTAELKKLSTIPSREGLLTMLAGGLLEIPRNLSIALDLYAKQKEENN